MREGRPPELDGLALLGHATTVGQTLPLGVDDPVIAARAVRRALAAARRHALEVKVLVIETAEPVSEETLARFARRALGPHGAGVRVQQATPSADGGFDTTVLMGSDLGTSGVGMIVRLSADGTVFAGCLGRARATRLRA